MEENFYSRTVALIGATAYEKLTNSHVAIFGLGGVGGYVLEGLVRAGIGKIDIIDHDVISITNFNRQILATTHSIGTKKTQVAMERAKTINPNIIINAHDDFLSPDTSFNYDFHSYDYVVDAVDTVTAKIELVVQCNHAKTPIISCMGTGNKLDATAFQIADLYSTSVCPLARVMRRELKARGINSLKVLFSKEPPKKGDFFLFSNDAILTNPPTIPEENIMRKIPPSSISFVPSVAGLIIAGEVIKDLIK